MKLFYNVFKIRGKDRKQMNTEGERKMKNKAVKVVIFGMALLGILGIAYGASRKYRNRNRVPNDAVYINNNVGSSQNVTMEKAKSIALAQVPGANESHFGEIDLDHDHGRTVYEIEIFYNNSKYEFDIDASTGEIIGTEVKHYN